MKHKKLIIGLILILLLCAAGWIYIADDYPANETAAAAMNTTGGVTVKQDKNFTAFMPDQAGAGFIFYPGGRVEHTAYAPLMRMLAEEGVLSVLVEMPLNLAVLDMNAADGIPEQFPQIERWYIGGHSLGGSMAASHAAKNPGKYEGLVLLASYSTSDLSASGMQAISVYGSEDGILNLEKYAESKANLPENFAEYIIEGGNHAGFGSYGPQDGDGISTVAHDEQLAETVRLLTGFLR